MSRPPEPSTWTATPCAPQDWAAADEKDAQKSNKLTRGRREVENMTEFRRWLIRISPGRIQFNKVLHSSASSPFFVDFIPVRAIVGSGVFRTPPCPREGLSLPMRIMPTT